MDPLLAWRRWRASLDPGDGRSATGPSMYPWSVLRFLTTRRKGRLEEYTEGDLREFLLREAATAYERRYYERTVRSFFAWCRYLTGTAQAPSSTSNPPDRGSVGPWPKLQPLLRLVVVIALAIALEVSLAMTIIGSTK
jgi:hypothetical protein